MNRNLARARAEIVVQQVVQLPDDARVGTLAARYFAETGGVLVAAILPAPQAKSLVEHSLLHEGEIGSPARQEADVDGELLRLRKKGNAASALIAKRALPVVLTA